MNETRRHHPRFDVVAISALLAASALEYAIAVGLVVFLVRYLIRG